MVLRCTISKNCSEKEMQLDIDKTIKQKYDLHDFFFQNKNLNFMYEIL